MSSLLTMLRTIASGLWSLFRKKRVEGELDEELRGFLEMAAAEKMKQGMNRKDAPRAERLERGSAGLSKEHVHSYGWVSLMETFWQELLCAHHSVRRRS